MNKDKEIKILQSRLKSWEEEKQTNKHGWQQVADKNISAIKEQLEKIVK